MISSLLLYIKTIRYLKPVQIRYRAYYALKKNWRRFVGQESKTRIFSGNIVNIDIEHSISHYKIYLGNNKFVFLNKEMAFSDKIDWNYTGFGKLWTYNLNYFEFLHQEDFELDTGLDLINDFIDNYSFINDGLEPFPTSLRIINWIKFLLLNDINDDKINKNLYNQSFRLYHNIEYHLQGNHLLENAFALLYSGIYFDDDKLIEKGEKLLFSQLEEQILNDGAHFELSPMYHQLMFFRLLDTINIAKNSNYNNNKMLGLLIKKAGLMYSWLDNITFSNMDIPLFNDSSIGIAPSSDKLIRYAKRLGVHNSQKPLNDSGYRKFKGKNYELIVDIGKIGPDYIPGHGHNDMFSFVLYIRDVPIIVDTGTSVYGGNPQRRVLERSTESHNTVKVGDFEQAQVWSDFRVAARSYPKIIVDEKTRLIVEYSHYTKKYKHRREFVIGKNNIEIVDTVSPQQNSLSYLHFDNDVYPRINGNKIDLSYCKIEVEGDKIKKKDYLLSKGFGNLKTSKKVEIEFSKRSMVSIDVI